MKKRALDTMQVFEQKLIDTPWVTKVQTTVEKNLYILVFEYTLPAQMPTGLDIAGPQECFLAEAEERVHMNGQIRSEVGFKPCFEQGSRVVSGRREYRYGPAQETPNFPDEEPFRFRIKDPDYVS